MPISFLSCPVNFFLFLQKPHGRPLFLPCLLLLFLSARSFPSIHKLYHLYFQNVVNPLSHPSLCRPGFLAQHPFLLSTRFRHLPSLVGLAVSHQPSSCFSLSPTVCRRIYTNHLQSSPKSPVVLRLGLESNTQSGRIGSASSFGF